MTVLTIGIDPGLTGAIAVLQDGRYDTLFDIPTILKGTGTVKTELEPSAIYKFLSEHQARGYSVKALLERVNAMPGQGVASMFSMGDTFGVLRACLSSSRTEHEFITPAKWKKYFGLTSDKEQSRAMASRLFPEADLSKKRHNDRAEALLIALYLWETQYA